jgi:hypothetical protein
LDERRGQFGSGAALASGFIEDDGSSGGNVERADAARHGNAQEMVASTADKIVQTGALATEDEDEIAGKVELVVIRGAVFVEADDPEVVLLEVFKRADQVDHSGDAEMLGCTGTGFDGYGAEGRCAAFCEDNTVDSGAVGHAQKGAEVLRIFNAIDREDKTRGETGHWRSKQVFDGEKFMRADVRDNALVGRCLGGGGQLVAGLLKDADLSLPALCDEALEPLVMAFAGDQYVVKTPFAGLERFFNRVQAVENFHEF